MTSGEFQRGMLYAAQIVRLFADENMRMADDTIRLDPILNRRMRVQLKSLAEIEEAGRRSEQLALDGHNYASRAHAASDIADMIEARANAWKEKATE